MPREIIAILRGVKPNEVLDIAQALIERGISKIEIPLNSPDPMKSIELLLSNFSTQAEIGAGTVLTSTDVATLHSLGAKLVVAPNCNPQVIRSAFDAGMHAIPGVATASECFTAIEAGAAGLKLFPSFLIGTEGLKALRAVLPATTKIYAVGGVDDSNFSDWIQAGVTGFGVGSALYKPGDTSSVVSAKAAAMVLAYDQCTAR